MSSLFPTFDEEPPREKAKILLRHRPIDWTYELSEALGSVADLYGTNRMVVCEWLESGRLAGKECEVSLREVYDRSLGKWKEREGIQ